MSLPIASEMLSSYCYFPIDFYILRIGIICLSRMLQIIPKAVLMKQTKKLLNESSYYFQIWKDK